MSLQGSASTESVLRGRINKVDVITIDAYAVAVRNGFEGTEAEWLASLKGEKGNTPQKGVDYYTPEDVAEMESLISTECWSAMESQKDDMVQQILNELLDGDEVAY